jgi:hypothetical protein
MYDSICDTRDVLVVPEPLAFLLIGWVIVAPTQHHRFNESG